MVEVVLDRMLTEVEWDALKDPDGGRYEILDGRLVMSPCANADHNDLNVDLVVLLRSAIGEAGLDLRVTTDVEWRTVADDVVVQAPRGDVVVGTVDAVRRIHDALPLLVCEVWSAGTRPSVIDARRGYWRSLGLEHYWEILLDESAGDTAVSVWNLAADRIPRRAVGSDRLALVAPFAIELIPTELHGWVESRASASKARVHELEALAAASEARAAASDARAAVLEAENARLAERLRDRQRSVDDLDDGR